MLALATDLGLTVRPARYEDIPALVRLRRRSWREAYRGILPMTEVERATGPRSGQRLRRALEGGLRGQRLLVAERPGTGLLGFTWCGPQPLRTLEHRGEVYELYLDPDAQRRGVGSRLLDAAIWSLIDQSLHPVLVWVLAQNSARYFYEMRGGVIVAKGTIRIGDYVTTRVAYGWSQSLPLPYSRRGGTHGGGLPTRGESPASR
jgi:GNAT superfamily N-acetyltransferase